MMKSEFDRKSRFIRDTLDVIWPEFIDGGTEDVKGKVHRISDVMKDLTKYEEAEINKAFSLGAHHTFDAIEVIAKAYLIDVVIDGMWREHVENEEYEGRELEWAKP